MSPTRDRQFAPLRGGHRLDRVVHQVNQDLLDLIDLVSN
jgi:hypothetical protein